VLWVLWERVIDVGVRVVFVVGIIGMALAHPAAAAVYPL
jgi:hypothetical protein